MVAAVKQSPERMAALIALFESIPGRLTDRIVAYARALRARGEPVYARPAHYLAAASGTSSAALYALTLNRAVKQLVATSIQQPSTDADCLCNALRVGGSNHVDSPVLCDAWTDAESSEDPRDLPHPIVIGTGDTLEMDVTGTNLNTTGLTVRGFHVDDETAEMLRLAGELFVEGLNQTHSAATVMTANTDRLMTAAKRCTHLVAKETLTGDAARANVNLIIKGERLFPKEGKVIPPLSLRKAGAILDVDWAPSDGLQLDTRYTSSGGAGTAKLQLTFLGRRRFR